MMIIQKVARFLRIGRLPQAVRAQLESEGGVLFLDEGIPVSVILKNFRAPGAFCGFRFTSFIGFLALSGRRIVGRASLFHEASVNLAYEDARFPAIAFTVGKNRLSLGFNAEGLIPKASGEVTLRFRVSDPGKIAGILKSKGAKVLGRIQ